MSAATDNEDEIEASRAPLLDHLIELRQRLINCIIALFLAFILCFTFSAQAYAFLVHPFDIASSLLAIRAQEAKAGAQGFDWSAPFVQARDMFLVLAGMKHLAPVKGAVTHLISTAPLGIFFTKLKLAALGAVALSFPVLAQQVYAFVAPGLYKKERRAFLPFLIASPVLFVLGAALVYYAILPFVLWFSLNQQILGSGITVELLPNVTEYFDTVTTLLLAFGLCFQLPVILTLLALAGMVNSRMLIAGWRYAVVGIVVVAAIVTPPDPISQLLLSLPIVGLYFVSVGCVKLVELRHKDEDAAA